LSKVLLAEQLQPSGGGISHGAAHDMSGDQCDGENITCSLTEYNATKSVALNMLNPGRGSLF
jgi:hypothetical protein